MPEYWKISPVSSSGIEIIHEIPDPPLPNRIRNTQPKRLVQIYARDEINGRSVTRRGQCGSKGKNDQWEDCELGPVVTVEIEVCEEPLIYDPDSCAVERLPNWARGPWRKPRSFEFMTARGKRGLALVANPKQGGHCSAVVKISIGRSSPRNNGKTYVAIVAHSIFSTRDANRFVHGADGFLRLDENSNIVPLPVAEVAAKAIPVSQLVYFAAKQTNLLDGERPPERYFLVLDIVENPDTQRAMEKAVAALPVVNPVDPDTTLRANAGGVEGEMFALLAGTDPVYLWLNTIGRNPDTFGRYKISSFKIREALSYPSWMITIELVRK
ncbi:hypothetical protein HYALB_00006495 [Hymenoscyphus albidus]|uniref:Uncharacterized protein n=1 Tax=Hymenoscyphus albidus TaxID=595503 RepID=A0A9N9LMN1_9HELO|nr:hypothetical protein HYALB_00006495 [Hymenoscyphus albidus]